MESIADQQSGTVFRFIDDNALMVVLPAVNSFASMVFAYTNSSFNQTKEVRVREQP